ncbi:hypothetical protein [Anaeromyxobacter sp. Fw109-5]|uniref:hypothetical protein n=1 Tax=Anaeromyxobacter sp. (strain Fw109-5) TaxID=404589 RepID=UPI0000ED81E9|nr:hypothetical protein [Anaeromyxobacter sp. Fw109-5]ABS26033.1 cytochrome c family protein [Anaeromyxobacter sp. Fw109-5]
MKFMKLAVAAVASFAFGNAYAFHSGGVAECEGCHTMHNSLDGQPMIPADVMAANGLAQYEAGPYLLQGNQSENCLNCHQNSSQDPLAQDKGPTGYHISTQPSQLALAGDTAGVPAVPMQMTPGGDFGWIRADVPYAVRGTPATNHGSARGHNIVAPGYGYTADPVKTTAPGGSFVAANLMCSSCHDPHGRARVLDSTTADVQVVPALGGATAPIYTSGSYGATTKPGLAIGVFRILGGVGYAPKSYNAGAFTAPAPVAAAPSSYNASEAVSETVVAYGKGMSEYCANCHPAMLQNGYVSGTSMQVHPAGNGAPLGATIAANYLAYVKSGDLSKTGANYTSLIPFETGVVDTGALRPLSGRLAPGAGPVAEATDNVSCLSCHRAHASGFDSMLRFAHENEFMTIADATGAAAFDTNAAEGKVNRGFYGKVAQETQYYGRPATKFAPYQRLLCNKCHAKD